MSTRLSLLCVHGVGHAEIDAEFRKSWSEAIIRAVQSVDQSLNPAIDFLSYDDLFDKSPPNLITYGIALAKLLASATVHGVGDLLVGHTQPRRCTNPDQMDRGHGRPVVGG